MAAACKVDVHIQYQKQLHCTSLEAPAADVIGAEDRHLPAKSRQPKAGSVSEGKSFPLTFEDTARSSGVCQVSVTLLLLIFSSLTVLGYNRSELLRLSLLATQKATSESGLLLDSSQPATQSN